MTDRNSTLAERCPRPAPHRGQPGPAHDELGGPLDPTAPRALWRLLQIGEGAGLVDLFVENTLVDLLRSGGADSSVVAVELSRFECSLSDLYVLVTLFSAIPSPVPVSTLAHETLVAPEQLFCSLNQLTKRRVIVITSDEADVPAAELTPWGHTLAVLLMCRVIALGSSQARARFRLVDRD